MGLVLILTQGNKYWRFEGNVLDADYPRYISVGFDTVPDDIDAAFAIPAASHRGKEKVYFFKGIVQALWWACIEHLAGGFFLGDYLLI